MLTKIKMRLYHFWESLKEDGWKYTIHEMIHLKKREVIVMNIDLERVGPPQDESQHQVELIAIDQSNFDSHNLQYPLKTAS